MEEIKLTNGIRVAMESLPYLRSFSIGLWVGAGCVHEKNADNGISHFIEHMLFKGTSSRSSREIAACIDALGGNLNAFTAKDCTCFYVNVLSAHYGVAIDLLCDMLLNATLSPEDILREQGVVCEEISMVEDTPDDLAEEKLAQAFYGDHPLGQAILGPAENVRGFSRDTILDYMDKRYVPSNIVISVAGSFEREAVLEMLEEKTAALRADKPVSGITPYEPISDTVISVQKEIEQINLCLGYPGASRESDAYFAQSMLANIFGGGMSSRLFQRVREQNGMTYAIYRFRLFRCVCRHEPRSGFGRSFPDP